MTEFKYDKEEYINYDPLEGDMDSDVRLRKVKIVRLRKEQQCNYATDGHTIQAGEYSRCETGIVSGEFERLDICIPCIERELDEINGFGDCCVCGEYTQNICPSCGNPACESCICWGGNICEKCGKELDEWGCSDD